MKFRNKKHLIDASRTRNSSFRETAHLMCNPVMSGRISCSLCQLHGRIPNGMTLAAMRETEEILKRKRKFQ